MKVNFNVTNQLATPAIHAAALANRPAAGQPGRVFIDTDSPSTGIYRDTGSVWVQVASTSSPEADTLQTVTDRGNTTTQDVAIGTSSTPTAPLDVHGAGVIQILQGTGTNDSFLQFNKSGNGKFKVGNVHNAGNDYFTVYNLQENSDAILVNISTNNVAIGGGTVTPTYKLDITGSLRNTGNAYFGTSGNTVSINTITPISTSALSIQKGSFTENLTLLSASGDTRIEFRSDSGTIAGGIKLDSGGLGMGGGASFRGAVYVSRTTNNVIINAGSDAGFKFDCYGTARIQGSTQIAGNGATTLDIFGGAGGSGSQTVRIYGSTSNTQGLFLTYDTGTAVSFIDGAYHATASGNAFGDIVFRSKKNATNTLAENMRIRGFDGNILIGTSTNVAAAILNIVSTTQGVKFPSMTTAQKNAIANTAGLVVFDTTLAKLCVNSGAGWETITSV